jgi:hypothetical protein
MENLKNFTKFSSLRRHAVKGLKGSCYVVAVRVGGATGYGLRRARGRGVGRQTGLGDGYGGEDDERLPRWLAAVGGKWENVVGDRSIRQVARPGPF